MARMGEGLRRPHVPQINTLGALAQWQKNRAKQHNCSAQTNFLYDRHRTNLGFLPATPDKANGDRGQKKRNDFGNTAQTLFAHPAGEAIGVA